MASTIIETERVFKKARCLTRPSHARQDVPFLGQGCSMAYRVPEGATVVAERTGGVREHDNRARTQLADFCNTPIKPVSSYFTVVF